MEFSELLQQPDSSESEQEQIAYEYLQRFPDSLTRRQIDFENDELMARIVPLMQKALSTGEPLTDDIFNAPDDADL